MTVTAVPKPSRVERLLAQDEARRQRLRANLQRSLTKQRTSYGGSDWPAFKAHILARDGHRCVMPKCETARLGVTVHHLIHVGAGGKNTDENCASLCAACHEATENGTLRRREIRAVLSDKYGYSYAGEKE